MKDRDRQQTKQPDIVHRLGASIRNFLQQKKKSTNIRRQGVFTFSLSLSPAHSLFATVLTINSHRQNTLARRCSRSSKLSPERFSPRLFSPVFVRFVRFFFARFYRATFF